MSILIFCRLIDNDFFQLLNIDVTYTLLFTPFLVT